MTQTGRRDALLRRMNWSSIFGQSSLAEAELLLSVSISLTSWARKVLDSGWLNTHSELQARMYQLIEVPE